MSDNKLPIIIFELANTHNGQISLLKKSVNFIKSLNYKNKAIKFQIFDPDKISTKNYEWYKVYKRLFFNQVAWSKIINYTSDFCKIYLDIFDTYSVEILKKNLPNIHGIKLQPSIIYNHHVYKKLSQINYKKEIILNISGFSLEEIKNILNKYEKISKKIVLQVGFQSYPTKIEFTGLDKILTLKKQFSNYQFSLADHIDGNDNFASIVPLIAHFYKINIIEKHFCLSKNISKYDLASSLDSKQIIEMISNILKFNMLKLKRTFINKYEKQYLLSSTQQTLLKKPLFAGSLISLNDVDFKRSNKKGIDFNEILKLQSKRYILKSKKSVDSIFLRKDFKKAKIGTFVACRMKSTRLQNKALLNIGNQPSIIHCINNCIKSRFSKLIILATSNLIEDNVLANLKIKKNFKIFRGSADNVVDRYINCAKKYKVDIIVRVTGDCPFVSSEIIDFLIQKHFENGADYTAAKVSSVGTSAEIINTQSLHLIHKMMKNNISEYMTFYFLNNKEFFKVNIVELPKNFVRNYRLTLDYKEDLMMFNKLFFNLKRRKLKNNLKNIFKILDQNKRIRRINSSKKLVYKHNKKFLHYLNKNAKFNG